MIPLKTRLTNFIGVVSFVADKELQNQAWINKTKSLTSIFCLGELYCQFFDDNEIDNFIDNELISSPLTDIQRKAIRQFRDALNAFSGAPGKERVEKSASDLIDDPEWNDLVELAKLTRKLFLE